jgi:hypothetical protein
MPRLEHEATGGEQAGFMADLQVRPLLEQLLRDKGEFLRRLTRTKSHYGKETRLPSSDLRPPDPSESHAIRQSTQISHRVHEVNLGYK